MVLPVVIVGLALFALAFVGLNRLLPTIFGLGSLIGVIFGLYLIYLGFMGSNESTFIWGVCSCWPPGQCWFTSNPPGAISWWPMMGAHGLREVSDGASRFRIGWLRSFSLAFWGLDFIDASMHLFQGTFQVMETQAHASFHRAEGSVCTHGDFAVCPALEIGQFDDSALFWWDLAESITYLGTLDQPPGIFPDIGAGGALINQALKIYHERQG